MSSLIFFPTVLFPCRLHMLIILMLHSHSNQNEHVLSMFFLHRTYKERFNFFALKNNGFIFQLLTVGVLQGPLSTIGSLDSCLKHLQGCHMFWGWVPLSQVYALPQYAVKHWHCFEEVNPYTIKVMLSE